ncbi:hypothetical protein RBG61_05885 [Paludicola sp. MB14-C6]|uniref:hypothetical protein n=1 Tax=Paludihabitans sp. MB14-C6 TaxID=3070656 RepID=UPI0027DB7C1E|nr:hypothetical protein [Paludicola sp. MB14-C6]WMJ24195.1 hypothetical protein RBG61_05885 [Paludicola sp. MB14-C6]
MKKTFYIAIGVAFGCLTKLLLDSFLPNVSGISYIALIILSLALIIVLLSLIFKLTDYYKKKKDSITQMKTSVYSQDKTK